MVTEDAGEVLTVAGERQLHDLKERAGTHGTVQTSLLIRVLCLTFQRFVDIEGMEF